MRTLQETIDDVMAYTDQVPQRYGEDSYLAVLHRDVVAHLKAAQGQEQANDQSTRA